MSVFVCMTVSYFNILPSLSQTLSFLIKSDYTVINTLVLTNSHHCVIDAEHQLCDD